MADFKFITRQGVIVPDTANLRADVEAEWKAAFGQDLVVTPESSQGVMITTQVQTRDAVARNNAELANQINPDIAGGVFLDSIWNLTGGRRRRTTRSVVSGVQFGGVQNTIIPVGSLAIVESTGQAFKTITPMIIGAGGSVTGEMESVNFGPILAGPGELAGVGSSVLGWETVTNPASAVPGKTQESDTASRGRRRLTLALNTISLSEAVISGLYNIDTVRSLSFRENYTKVDATIDGIFLKANSIYACVEGGGDLEVATVLAREKTFGAGYNGAITIPVVDPASGQTYPVQFDRPTEVFVFARVTVAASTLDAQAQIPAIIQDYINGEIEGGQGLTVGADVSAFELAGVINQVEPRFFVRNLELSTDSGSTWTRDTVAVALDQVARMPTSAILVVTA